VVRRRLSKKRLCPLFLPFFFGVNEGSFKQTRYDVGWDAAPSNINLRFAVCVLRFAVFAVVGRGFYVLPRKMGSDVDVFATGTKQLVLQCSRTPAGKALQIADSLSDQVELDLTDHWIENRRRAPD
jgi:hypothetical protein